MTLENRMKQAKKILAKDPHSKDPRVLEMKERIAAAKKEAAEKKKQSDPAPQETKKEENKRGK